MLHVLCGGGWVCRTSGCPNQYNLACHARQQMHANCQASFLSHTESDGYQTCTSVTLLTSPTSWYPAHAHVTPVQYGRVQGGGHPQGHTAMPCPGLRLANSKFCSRAAARTQLRLSRAVRMTQIGHLVSKLWPKNRKREYLRRIRGPWPTWHTEGHRKVCG
jgi:hypothetical protein